MVTGVMDLRDTGERTELAAPFRELELCTRCGELRGPVTWTDGRDRRRLLQECACQRGLRSEPAPRWWGFDFNVVAELCRVCGADVVASGTRFAAPVCAACRARAVGLGPGDRLDLWSREALFRNLVEAGLAHRSIVPLADYLEVVQQVDRGRRVEECIDFLGCGAVAG